MGFFQFLSYCGTVGSTTKALAPPCRGQQIPERTAGESETTKLFQKRKGKKKFHPTASECQSMGLSHTRPEHSAQSAQLRAAEAASLTAFLEIVPCPRG